MTSVQPLTSGPGAGDDGPDPTPPRAVDGVDLDPDRGLAEPVAGRTLVGQAMVERAKTVIVVAERVDDEEAGQILLDAASQAAIPVRVAADQVMMALQADVEKGGIQDITMRDTLLRALGSVRPVAPPQDPEAPPAPGPTHQET